VREDRGLRGDVIEPGRYMSVRKIAITAVLTFVLSPGPVVVAQNAGQNGEQRLAPEEVVWPTSATGGIGTSGVYGVQTVVLKGDPTKAGLYALLLRAGPNIRALSHAHQDDRVATVISGMWYLGYGDTFDEARLKELPPGSFYTEPPGSNHFAMTKEEPVVIQITGMGPTSTTYVNPDDDPSR
jgi:hypothetical protein